MPRNLLLFAVTVSAVLLTGCVPNANAPWEKPQTQSTPTSQETPPPTGQMQPPQTEPNQITAKVALLLPLTGKGADTGQAMLNASQLAMFDLNASSLFELIPEDTGNGATAAMNAATTGGANLVIGPLFSTDTKTVSPLALQSGINVVSFSTDTTAAVGNTFLMGFMPQAQVEQVMAYAVGKGLTHIGLIAPRDVYGDSVAATFYTTVQKYGLKSGGIIRFNAGTIPSESDIAGLEQGTNAVLIASPALESSKISNLLTQKGFSPATTKRLGTGLWDQPESAKLSGLQGAWYAASSPRLRSRFEQRYFSTYGTQPPRIASLAYDATALAVVLAKSGRGFDRTALTNPNGFAGIDGIFRLNQQGLAERGLAILEINNGAASLIQDAPQRF